MNNPDARYTEAHLQAAFNRGAVASCDSILSNVTAMKQASTFPGGNHKVFPAELLVAWGLPPELEGVSIPAVCGFVEHVIRIARNAISTETTG